MPRKKVFVASTGIDLSDYRAAVIQAIRGLDDYHCICMETFGSRDAEADSFCRQQVGECDLFIGIIGHCYGDTPKGAKDSYTHREYREAKGKGVPRLMFLADREFPVPASLILKAAAHESRQQAFRKEVNRETIRQEFRSREDLVIKVLQAIHNWHQKSLTASAEQRANALAKLAGRYVLHTKNLPIALKHITEELARTLRVERVGIWRFSEDRAAITCSESYRLSGHHHSVGGQLVCDVYPSYFETLATSEVLAVEDAQHDSRTSELANYLIENRIVSMMDVPIHLFGAVGGVLCHEHAGEIRKWTPDEITFAIAAANLVSLAIEQCEQRRK